MKQRITAAQLNELSSQAKDKLSAWWHEKNGRPLDPNYVHGCQWLKTLEGGLVELHYLPYLTIGEMIEWLADAPLYMQKQSAWHGGRWHVTYASQPLGKMKLTLADLDQVATMSQGEELCDALWTAVKSILESA